MKPEIQEIVDEIRYFWQELGVALTLRGLHPTESGAWRGMLEGQSLRPEDRRNGGGHLLWGAVTITDDHARARIVQRLQKRVPRGPDEWDQDIDRCFYDAYCRKAHVPDPVDLADVVLDSVETRYLFEPVLPEGQITLLLADQGSSKSYLMLYLACCTVLGVSSVFGPPRRTGPVIYFDWEVDAQVARRRLTWICRGLGCEVPHGLRYVNMSERGRLMDSTREMRQQIERLDAVMAVVDSLTFATGGDLNNPEYAAPTMSAIGSLGDGVTKLVSAHPSKQQRKQEADEISVIGSGLFEFRARAIWHLKRETHRSANFLVKMQTRKPFDGAPLAPLAYRMGFDNEGHATRFSPASLKESAEFSKSVLSLNERIRVALRKGPLDTNQLAEKVGVEASVVRTRCNEMGDVFPVTSGNAGGRGHATVWTLVDLSTLDAQEDGGDDPQLPF